MIIVHVIDIYSRIFMVGRVECSVVANCIQAEWEHQKGMIRHMALDLWVTYITQYAIRLIGYDLGLRGLQCSVVGDNVGWPMQGKSERTNGEQNKNGN